MPFLTLLYKQPKKTAISRTVGGATATITLDAQLKEQFTAPCEPTSHPIEKGADITDHIIIKPNKLSIEGLITETPLTLGASIVGAASTAAAATVASQVGAGLGKTFAGVLGGIAGGAVTKSLFSAFGASTERDLGDVVKEFVALRDAKSPVSIQTGLTEYKDYLLSNFTASRDQKSGRSIRVSLEFQQNLQAETQTVSIPAIRNALPKVLGGRKNGSPLSAEKNAPASSFLNNILRGGQF